MKNIILLFFVYACSSNNIPRHTMTETNRREKEAIEIAYITECIKSNKDVDSLIEWKKYGNQEIPISYEFKDYLVFFNLFDDTANKALKSIVYYHNSFRKIIFENKSQRKFEITKQTKLKVWMSKDKLSVYFCMINSDNIKIWVLTNGNWVYSSSTSL